MLHHSSISSESLLFVKSTSLGVSGPERVNGVLHANAVVRLYGVCYDAEWLE